MILIKGKYIVLASTLVLGALSMQPALANIQVEAGAKTTLFNVSHVKKNDNLNVRAGAGVGNEIVTTIPFDGKGIELLGDETTLGKTRWVLIKWKGLTGWVSKYYLDAGQSPVAASIEKVAIESTAEEKASATGVVDSVEKLAEKEIVTEKGEVSAVDVSESKEGQSDLKDQVAAPREEWVLRCGNKSPYWKVDVHPKWMEVLKGEYETGLPITKKKQDKNRWNTALKTVLEGKKGRNNLEMTIKYAYSKRCYDTLSGLRVPYKVTTKFNGEELTGCCRAVKVVLNEKKETKVSMK
ncbi:MAG: SH3 domain-containing protein [Thiotrichaceae bacterium]